MTTTKTDLRCPRCGRDALRPAPFCAGCGAPLLLGDDAVRPLDMMLDLDRRTRVQRGSEPAPASVAAPRMPPPLPALAPARAAQLEPVEPSEWDIGAGAAAAVVPASRTPDEALPDAEVDALEVHVQRPEPWRRAAAWALDALPFAVAGVALGRFVLREAGAALPGPSAGIDVLLDALARERVIVLPVAAAVALALTVYVTVAHALAGATLGKRLLHLRVIGPDGASPSPARSVARSVLAVASAGLLGLGLLLALFTRSGRGLHDLLARTWVVKAP